MHNAASMETNDLTDLIISLVDELIRRDRSEPAHLYAVTGTHAADDPQITGDFVVAADEEQAAEHVGRARGLCSDGWTHDLTSLHLEDIRSSVIALKIPPITHTNDLKMVLSEFE